EVILGRLTVRNFSAVVISAVTASVVSQSYWGNQPAFHVPAYNLNSFVELPIYVVLGVLASLIAVLFIRVLYRAEAIFDHWSVPLAVRTAVGMILTGSLVFFFPEREILGSGLHLIGETIAGDFSLPLLTMFLLLIAKLLATTFTLGAGNSGGVFAPSLFMGAVLGGIVGTLGQQLWPTVVQNPGAYAIVGMAAVFAGAARAPITAILIVFEMSNDYQLILPLMLATVLATIMAELLFSESIYTLKLKLKGINLHRGRDEDVLKSVTAKDVMRPITHPVKPSTPVADLLEIFGDTHLHGLPVMDDDGGLFGVVTLHDIEESRHVPAGQLTVGDVATPYSKLILAFPDDTVDVVLRSMRPRELGHIPVVAREQPRHLLGFLRREDILKAYELALVRRQSLQNQARALNLNYHPGMIVTDVIITPHSEVVGKKVMEIAPRLPQKCVLVSIQREGNVIVPHGDTQLRAGDTITMFLDKSVADHTCSLFATNATLTEVQSS
ncbi:MAG: chloride channel protein, partial [Anaerolineales bacterium]|nr:chloride channel protein [Anaerolineales bacterium]